MGATDAQLITHAREDPEALAELYLRYRERLYRWFRLRLPEAAAYLSSTAELFAQVALGLKRFRDEANGSAAPWLYGIAKNLLRRYYERPIEENGRRRLGLPIRSYEQDFEAIEERIQRASSRATSNRHSTRFRRPNEKRSRCASSVSFRTRRSPPRSAARRLRHEYV